MKINGEDRGRRGEYSRPEEPDVSEKRYRTVIEQAADQAASAAYPELLAFVVRE